MDCSRCSNEMTPGYSYDLPDDSEPLSFRSWRCSSCRNGVEEIHTSSHKRIGETRLIRYAVRAVTA